MLEHKRQRADFSLVDELYMSFLLVLCMNPEESAPGR